MPLLKPHRYFTRISKIDPRADLADAGIRVLLLDMDNTLLTRDTHEVPEDVRAWLASVRAAGIRPCLLTNNWHQAAFDWAERLDMPVVAKALKPLPFSYVRALRLMGVKRREVACIGDQLMTDIWGGKLAGMRTFMVDPLVSADLKHTLFLRKFEAAIMEGVVPEQ